MAELTTFAESHLDGALRLSQAVGWPHRRADWALVAAVSEGVAALDGGEVVGTAFCTRFGDLAALNMIIVAARLQGRGIGRRLIERIVALADGRAMTLVATPEGLPLYERAGFAATGRIVQHQGIARAAPAPAHPVRRGGAADLARIAALDRAATGMDRGGVLARIAAEGTLFLGGGGFACRRPFGRGEVIGPIVAPDAAAAAALLHAAAAGCEGRFLRVDTPADAGLGPALGTLGLAAVDEGITMRKGPAPGPAPRGAPARFALISQALG